MTTHARRAMPAVVLVLAACSAMSPTPSAAPSEAAQAARAPITIGSGPSVELQLVSELYAQALEASGFEVDRLEPAVDAAALLASLRGGEVDLAASVLTELAAEGDGSPKAGAIDAIRSVLADDGISVLAPTDAERGLAVAMRSEGANDAGIATISELASGGRAVKWGLPSDCSAIPACARLVTIYGLALDQLTISPVAPCAAESGTALNDGIVDATLVCTTQPELERLNLLVLDDDRAALPAGTVAPVVRTEVLDAAPAEFEEVVDAISAKIDTPTLTSLGVQVTVEQRPVAEVAREWLRNNGLI